MSLGSYNEEEENNDLQDTLDVTDPMKSPGVICFVVSQRSPQVLRISLILFMISADLLGST